MRDTTVGVRCGRLLFALLAATLFLGWSAGVGSALAAPMSGSSQVVVAAPVVDTSPDVANCCAGAWYPWGWYSTRAKCTAAGKNAVATIGVALAYKCSYVSNPPASANGRHYHLYVFEAT